MRICLLSLVLLALSVRHDAAAQFATVAGEIVDEESEQAVAGVNVRLVGEGQERGTATNASGRFLFSSIEPGSYVLTASHVGYSDWTDSLDVAFGERIQMLIHLVAASEEMDEVVVESEDGDEPVVAEGAGHLRVGPAALQMIPLPDVSADLAAFLLTRPGIHSPGDRGGQLFIRGGTPTQNLVLLDGMHIYRPFHIVGFYSIFPADIIAHADVYAGGFGAEYGGRISSVVEVTTRNGSKQDFVGSASIAPFLASVRAEIPLVPGKVSLLTSLRESVIERVSPTLIDARLPYRFGDRFVKMHAYLNRTSSMTATLMHSFDEGDIAALEGEERISTWTNTAGGGRYFYLPEDFPATAEFAFYGTRYESRYLPAEGEERVSDVQTLEMKIRFAYLLGDLQLHAGIGGLTNWLDYDLGRGHSRRKENFTEGGFFFLTDWDAEHVRLNPGFRIQTYAHSARTLIEPRLRLRWRPGGRYGKQSFSAAWGVYHQQFLGLNNQRDVTDAFTAWTASPSEAPLPRSVHVLAGTERRILPFLTLGVEGYVRELQHIHFPFFESGLTGVAELERVDGEARGLDVTLELHRPWLYVYAGYGLSLVEYRRLRRLTSTGTVVGGDGTFTPPHDRRHSLNLHAQFSIGSFQVQARWQFGSGVPFTPIAEYYYATPPNSPDDRNHLTSVGSPQTLFGRSYSRRLPAYHRLDVSAERRFEFQGWSLIAQAGVINAYDRNNIFSYDVLGNRRVDQLPLIPSAGIRVEIDAR